MALKLLWRIYLQSAFVCADTSGKSTPEQAVKTVEKIAKSLGSTVHHYV